MINNPFQNYPDDADYNTNSPSYYEELARKQKLIQLLSEKIWKYENTLNETLEQIKKRLTDYILENDLLMNERLENWDQRIDEMPEEMRSLFVTWLNDGTLEQIINHDVLGNKADQSELDKTNDQVTLHELVVKQIVSVEEFGAVGDYNNETETGTDDTLAFEQAIEKVNAINGKLLIPNKKYLISGNVKFPKFVENYGKMFGGTVVFETMKDPHVSNLKAEYIHLSGVWRAEIEITEATEILYDAHADWHGSYWNNIKLGYIDKMVMDISEGAINQSQFTGGRLRELHLTGSAEKYPTCEAHNNKFVNVDLSYPGVLQDDDKMQTNYLIGCYSEQARETDLIVGNWEVYGFTGEKTPKIGLESHIFGSSNARPSTAQDFLSMSTNGNLIEGGEWNSLTVTGLPKGVIVGSASQSVVNDNSAPDGSGRALKIETNSQWAYVELRLSDRISILSSITLYLKGDLFVATENVGEDGSIYNGINTHIKLANDWNLYRIIVNGRRIDKVRLYINRTGTDKKTVYISGIKATPNKAGQLPMFDTSRYNRGVVSSVPTAGVWRKGEFVMNSENTEVNGWRCVSVDPLEFKAF